MLAGKATYSVIIAATGLSLQTVRTIASREGKDRNERLKLAGAKASAMRSGGSVAATVGANS